MKSKAILAVVMVAILLTATNLCSATYEIIDLGSLGGKSRANSINASGQVVGKADDSFGESHAVLFDSTGGGVNTDLGSLGGLNSRAYSINDSGQIVGNAASSSGDNFACLFDATGDADNIDLNALIDPTVGWTLEYAYSINNDGWIVGTGINPDGYEHAYLLTPEPTTLLLLGLGAVMVRKRR